MILAPLLLALAAAAPAQDFMMPEEIGTVMRGMRNVAAQSKAAARPPAAASAEADAFARALTAGLWGGGRADRLPSPLPRAFALTAPDATAQATPINRGFQGLGPAGKTGRVKGPGIFGSGDGTYRVIENTPWQVVLQMKTGYIDGRFTLKRDAVTGKDSLGFAGRLWDADNGRMGPPTDSVNDGQVSYDAASDAGRIAWRLNGEWKQDAYHGGRAGATGMTITLGGHGHDFLQD
ncbi:MAG: hypothetical protein KGL74_13565 [Elusimicrobia bacterium]|nr:hypothetical protein [Elusimicrobiota bacterium]MDE2512147.1 hypothetical protein [Elusimicrobiota bacterium]